MMDAKRFLTEYSRMCDYYTTHKENGCGSCPLFEIDCGLYPNNHDRDKIIDLVEKWADEHERKTNFQKLKADIKEMFPDRITIINNQGNVIIHSSDPDFWKKEYEEDNTGSFVI